MTADSLQALLDIRAIEQLKYRYIRAIDTQDWDLMATVVAEDFVSWYQDGTYRAQSPAAWLKFCREVITFHSSHIATQPEIELTGPTTAAGIWRMQDIVHMNQHMNGAGYYYDQYRKVDGRWLITSTGYVRIFLHTAPAVGGDERLVADPRHGRRPEWLGASVNR